jgi:hypothetical protein
MITLFDLLAVLRDNVVLSTLRFNRGSVRLDLVEGVGESIRHFG